MEENRKEEIRQLLKRYYNFPPDQLVNELFIYIDCCIEEEETIP